MGQLFSVTMVVLIFLGGTAGDLLAEQLESGSATTSALSTININTASADQLANSLTGIGNAKAQAIVEYREQNGAFTNKNQLLNVKGIGESTLTKNSALIVLK
ncbi:MAG: hypothetical protein DRR06_16740 [Gammaproteobacteria bacterium]|nr:MAG: hypothetical protein DRR06_16740 [Gammaproteobacteria bacterium]